MSTTHIQPTSTSTDEAIKVLKRLQHEAAQWTRGYTIVGGVTAGQIVDALSSVLPGLEYHNDRTNE